MDEILKTAMRITLVFMAAWLIVWAIFPETRTIAAGILLGTAASAMNALLLRRRVEALGQAAVGGGKNRMGMGLASRLATVLLAAMIAYRFPDKFELPAVLLACFSVQFAVLISAVYHNTRQMRRKG